MTFLDDMKEIYFILTISKRVDSNIILLLAANVIK
jgi:hypothetical protein